MRIDTAVARIGDFAAALLSLILCATPAMAIEWPQEITTPEGTIVIYQPQPEKLEGNVLSGRAAMSLELTGRDEAIFGAFWFEAKIDTDTDAGTALIRSVKVTNVRWPDSTDANEQRFTAIVEGAVPENGFEISLERLSASLESAQTEQRSLAELKNDPPKILFREELAVLLLYDGEPRFSPVENSDYERALNTPFVVLRHKKGGDLFLSSGKFWYVAKDPLRPWAPTNTPPQELVKMMPEPETDEPAPDAPPAIVVATEPTELIVTQGEPDWQSLPGGTLLYVQNTETPWLRELSTNNLYLLLSGRWYRSKSLEGPWTFVRADELPASFQDIPPESAIGGLRASVAGTEEAEDAVLDAHIPQTAAIKRSEAKLDVQYDGEPKFEKIAGTNVAYAVNTGAQVLAIGGRYYAVDNGVWFTSASAKGPWAVADTIPAEEIGKIPPSSPVYNVTHVHVYQSTPEVVYVGYTPGYLWSFPYYGVPVYGTGWYYPPYWGTWYYPRPPTWGFHVGYNPWTGWNFGMSWSNGFFSFGMSWGGGWGGYYRPWGCCGGWYGGGYRGPTIINTGNINIGNSINIGNRTQIGNRIDRDTNLNLDRARTNLYNKSQNRGRIADRTTARANLKQPRPAANRANNVFADRDGRVARQANGQWQSRESGQWRSAGAAAGDRLSPQTRQGVQSAAQSRGIDRSSLNRSYQMRQHGMSREASRPMAMRGRGRR
jgi:hypothetical protein